MRRIHFPRKLFDRKKSGRVWRMAIALMLLAVLTGCASGGYYDSDDGLYYPAWYGPAYYGLDEGVAGPEVVVVEPHHHRGDFDHNFHGRHFGSRNPGTGFHGGFVHGGFVHGGFVHGGLTHGGGGGGHAGGGHGR